MNESARRWWDTILAAGSVVAFLGAWEIAVSADMVNRLLLPSPTDVGRVAIEQVRSGELLGHVVVSLGRIASGFLIGAGAGIMAGVLIGTYRPLRTVVYPMVEVLRPIPPLAWIPLAIIWFGIEEASKVFLLSVTAFFPIFVNTYKGVRNIDPTLIRAARSLEMKSSGVMVKIAIPAAMPDITTGLRFSWSLVFAVIVAAEMIAAQSGLGFLVTDAMNLGRFDVVVFGIVVIGVLSVATDYLWQVVSSRWLLRWHRGLDAVAE